MKCKDTKLHYDYQFILINDPCCYCGALMEHVDHIEPISSGGENEWYNLTGACGKCNLRKRAKPLLSFMLEEVSSCV